MPVNGTNIVAKKLINSAMFKILFFKKISFQNKWLVTSNKSKRIISINI